MGGGGGGGRRPRGACLPWRIPVGPSAATCFHALPGGDFVLVGLRSGEVRVLRLPAAPAGRWAWTPYSVPPDAAGSSDEVALLGAQPGARERRALVGFACGCLVLWDLPARRLVATSDQGREALAAVADCGGVTAAAWAGGSGLRLAAGYDSGDVVLWGLGAVIAGNTPHTLTGVVTNGLWGINNCAAMAGIIYAALWQPPESTESKEETQR